MTAWLSLPDEVRFADGSSIELKSIDGDEESLAQAARASRAKFNRNRNHEETKIRDHQDKRLIERLIKDNHGSPLEFASMTFRVVCPIFIGRQWFRHRVANYSEKSARYVVCLGEFLKIHEFRTQSETNKQMSSKSEVFTSEANLKFKKLYEETMQVAGMVYNKLIELGVAREQARAVLPQGYFTEFYCKMNIRSLLNFLKLRCAEDAQPEIRQHALVIRDQWLRDAFPTIYTILMETANVK